MSEIPREEDFKQDEGLIGEEKKIMVDIICSYCGKFLGQKESLEQKISHGVCPDCYKKMMEELDNE